MISVDTAYRSAKKMYSPIRNNVLEPFRYRTSRLTRIARHKPVLSILLLSDGIVSTSEAQFDPLLRYRTRLGAEHGLLIQRALIDPSGKLSRVGLQNFDVVCLKLAYTTTPFAALQLTVRVRSLMRSDARLLYFDGDDDLCIQWPDVLSQVDLYVKKHCFADLAEYTTDKIGKTNLTHYVARSYDLSFREDIIPTTPGVPEHLLDKIVVGWNIGFDDEIERIRQPLSKKLRTNSRRDIQVICRATVRPDLWTYYLRRNVLAELDQISERLVVRTPVERVAQKQYFHEMLNSHMCVSPFGYGEICWRDFEAIMCGCVLVKPDMSHVATYPDIFIPNETYVPVKWDYSDLTAKLEILTADIAYCAHLRDAALSKLKQSTSFDQFANRLRYVLDRVGVSLTR